MKKWKCVSSILITGLVLPLMASCSTDAQGEEQQDLTFTMGHMDPPHHIQGTEVMEPFDEKVGKLTNEKVNFQIYPGGALAGPDETYDNIELGVMESGRGLQGYNAGKFPVSAVMEMPFLAQGSAEEMSITFQQLYEEFPAIQEEYEGTKPLWLHTSDAYAIITKDEKVENFEDVKGMKIRSPSVQTSNMIESWGATSVSLPAPDIYDSMQKGVIDGAIIPVTAIEDFNLYDVVDYVTIGDFNTALFYVTMNKESWNEIPNQDQKIIEQELLGEPMASLAGQKFDELEQETEVEAKEQGIEFYELPEEEINKFENASENVTQNWIEDMESQGVEGQKIYNRAEELMTDNDK